MVTTIPNLFRLDDLRGQKIKLSLKDGQEYTCVPRDFTPWDGDVVYTLEILEGEDAGYDLDVKEEEIKEIQVL
ncbi:MAG: hypothetical protein ABRQ26_16605 [Syntrophomonadaceae bacterium]